jgi:hypothetical protein
MRVPSGDRRTSYRLACEKSCRLLEDVTLRPKPGDLFLQGCDFARSARICPFLGKAAAGIAVSSLVQRRSTLSDRPRSCAACAIATPQSVTNLTASVLNSRLNFCPVISILPFLGHDLIFVSKTGSSSEPAINATRKERGIGWRRQRLPVSHMSHDRNGQCFAATPH